MMNQQQHSQIERIEQTTRPEINPLLKMALTSRLALALQGWVGLAISIVLLYLAKEWDLKDASPWVFGSGFVIFGLAVGLPNLLYSVAHLIQSSGAIIEASVEVAIKRDLNNSGAIGDVEPLMLEGNTSHDPSPELPQPVPEEEARQKFIAHVTEFYQRAKNRGIGRNNWVEHLNKQGVKVPAEQWLDGSSITKDEHKAICDFLVRLGKIKNRRKGKEGEIDWEDEDSIELT